MESQAEGNVKQYRIQPTGIRFSPLESHSPFSTIGADRVLPFGLDLILEAMKVRPHTQLARMVNVIVNAEQFSSKKKKIKD